MFSPPMLLQIALSIVALVCYVLVLVKMFQNGQTGLGIACIVLLFCFGIGVLIAFIVGWVNAKKWNLMPVMLAWTGLIVVGILLNFVYPPPPLFEVPQVPR